MAEVMTYVTGRVGSDRVSQVVEGYRSAIVDGPPPSIESTYLVQDSEEMVAILTFWRTLADLENMRSSDEEPLARRLIREAGGDPEVRVLKVLASSAPSDSRVSAPRPRSGESTTRLLDQPVIHAPDGSEIRELPRLAGGSVSYCRLPAGAVTIPVRHRTVEEIWYVLGGKGQVWRDPGGEIVEVDPGTALTIPLGTAFQFRADPGIDLEMLLTTMPPWPGADEAVRVDGVWEPTVAMEPER